MDEAQRLAYLKAMGIQAWHPRHAGMAAAPAPLVQEPPPPVAASGVSGAPVVQPPLAEPATPISSAEPEDLFTAPTSARAPSAPAQTDVEDMDWEQLRHCVRECRACPLWETRQQSVFGVGAQEADLLIVGEAPGADEDREGEPFVGRAGQLLTRMLEAIGLSRDQVYIANVLKCRPPGNRDPRPAEILRCEGYLHRQVALLQPRLILSVGRISAQHLLQTDVSVGRLRGRWFDFGESSIPLRVTYHPAYLLRSPEQKAKSWADLTEVARRLRTGSPPA